MIYKNIFKERGNFGDSNDVPFVKLNASGNDFVLMNFSSRPTKESFPKETIYNICDRNYGIGCDQLIVIFQVSKNVIDVVIYNQDSSIVSMCGNGMRAVMGYFFDLYQDQVSCTVRIFCKDSYRSVVCTKEYNKNLAMIDLGNITIEDSKQGLVNIGNLHKVHILDSSQNLQNILENRPIENIYNVNYVQIINSKTIIVATIERGVGLTKSCGSGSCAGALYGISRGFLDNANIKIIPFKGKENDDFFVQIEKNKKLNTYNAFLIGGYNFNFYGLFANRR